MKPNPPLTPELQVTDYKRSLEFYTKIALFDIEYERPESKFAMLNKNGARLMIEEITEGPRDLRTGPLEHPFGRGIHLQIEVEDVQKAYDNFKAHNHPFFMDMEERWYRRDKEELGNKQFFFQDPDGYLLRFYQDLGSRSIQQN
jgi:catechol 2,3-dioxygenase-like lactoylglutathione lyase family enzyme